MAKKTRSPKRNRTKRTPKRKLNRVTPRRYDWRTKILAGAIAFALLAGGTFAHWRAKRDEVLIAKNTPHPVKNISTASQRDLADIPPEALHPQPPIAAGYNASSGGLPPGALPPGVVLPGMSPAGMSPTGMTPAGMSLGMMQGGRTTAQGYGVYDGIRQQFTGKERDTETGLDYFETRYYSSTQGRFTSVDPENADADPQDPQSWNGYAYARNNPLKYQDPDGRKVKICDTEGHCTEVSDENARNYLFNRQYAKTSGFSIDGKGRIYDANGSQIGSYVRTSFDDLSDQANAVIFGTNNSAGLVDRAPAAGRAAMGLWAGSVVAGATAGVGLYALGTGSTVTTLGLGAEATGGTSAATSITAATIHGAARLAARGFTEADIALTRTGTQLLQRDGATVFLKEVAPGRFNVIVEGGRGVVTALKNVPWNKVAALARNYGWYSPLK
jgi:RHS repeat-associated protein